MLVQWWCCDRRVLPVVQGDPRISDPGWARREGMVAFAGFPLVVNDRLLGVLAMFSRRPLSNAVVQALESVSGVIALGMMLCRGQFRANARNTREILGDLFTSSTLRVVADKAARRKSRLHLLPYGIPLCLGFVGYLVFLYGLQN